MSGLDFDPGFAAAQPEVGWRELDPERLYDALVLGAGPAGIAASIYLLRKGLVTGIIAKDLGGQVAWTASIENYPGFRLVDGRELVDRFRQQVAQFAPDVALDRGVDSATRREGRLAVRSGGSVYSARALVIATGKRPRALGVPGEERLLGRGVTYCAVCDAPLYRGRRVAVVGAGNSGVEAAIDLARMAERVVLVERGDNVTADAVLAGRLGGLANVEVLTGAEVLEISGEDAVAGLRVRAEGRERTIEVGGVIVEVGMTPNSEPFRDLVPLNERGEIEVDCSCRTAAEGVFAAGDVTSVPFKQVVVAAGEGAKAALAAHAHLLRTDSAG